MPRLTSPTLGDVDAGSSSDRTPNEPELFDIYGHSEDVAVQTMGDWEALAEYRPKSSGPDLGTMDEVDLLPPLLANCFVIGQAVWTNTPLRLGSGVLLPSASMGRILRQHQDDSASLWVYFGGEEYGLVSVRTHHLEKAAVDIDKELDETVANLHLPALGAELTNLTKEQTDYSPPST